jgi:hypothetical protein
MKEHPYASLAKSKRRSNLSVVGAFDVCQPHELALLRPQPLEQPRHIQLKRDIRFGCVEGVPTLVSPAPLVASAAPAIGNQVACDAKNEGSELPGVASCGRVTQEP